MNTCVISSPTNVVAPPNPKDNPKDHKEHPMSAPVNNENIILLVDQYLMQLPLEALQLLQMNHVSSVSREISLQMIFNKMHSGPSAGKYKHLQLNGNCCRYLGN